MAARLNFRWPFQSTVERGRWAETRASRFLEAKGHTVLAENYRCRRGEIDLVTTREGVLCFVEVKARRRRDYGGPLVAVDRRKRQRVAAAAEVYLAQNPHDGACRFDVVTLLRSGNRWQIEHLENAYEAGE